MKTTLFRSLEEAQGAFGPCALAIGNFDGVHAGHQKLIQEAVACAAEMGLVPAVLTFHPHPTAIVAPGRTPELICSLEERIRLLFQYGVRHLMVLPFTNTVAAMSPGEFADAVVVKALNSKVVLVGENFVFGRGQAGKSETLKVLGAELGFQTKFLPPVFVRGQLVSSSAIRRHLRAGAVSKAARLLSRCFSVDAAVVSGQGVGSKQTVPTLNQHPVAGQIYPRGVFVTETVDQLSRRIWSSITNVGTRPTFSGEELTIETYLLGALEGTPPAAIEVRFHRFVRSERQFADPHLLREQILKDVGRAHKFWCLSARLQKRQGGYTEGSA